MKDLGPVADLATAAGKPPEETPATPPRQLGSGYGPVEVFGKAARGISDLSAKAAKPFFRSAALLDLKGPTGTEENTAYREQAEGLADWGSKALGEGVPIAITSPLGGAGAARLAAGAGPILKWAAPHLGQAAASGATSAAQHPEHPVESALWSTGGSLVGSVGPQALGASWQQMIHPLIKKAAEKLWKAGQVAAKATHETGQAVSQGMHGISEAGERQAIREARGAHQAQQTAAKGAHEAEQAAAAEAHAGSQAAARAAHETEQAAAGSQHVLDAQRNREAQEGMRATLHVMNVQKIAERVQNLLPELKSFGADFFNMSRGEAGKKAIDESFGAVKAALEKRLGAGKIWVPEINPDAPITLEAATTALTGIGKGIGNAPSAVARSAGQGQAAFNYGKAREQIVQGLDMVSPGAGKIWDDAMRHRSAARAYMALVSKSLDANGMLDMTKLARNYNTLYGSLQRKLGPYYDEVTTALLQGPKGGGAVKVPGKVELAEPKPFQAEPFKETPFKPAPFKPEKFKKPAPAGIPKFQKEEFASTPFEPQNRLETLFLGPQAPYGVLGNMRLPAAVPPHIPVAMGTFGGAFPQVPILGAAALADSADPRRLIGRHRRHGLGDERD